MNNKTPKTMKHICTVLMLMGTLNSFAQKQWTLKECVEHALEYNISVKQSELDIDLANQDLVSAKGNFMPSLSGSASQNYNFGSFIGQDGARIKRDTRGNNFGLNTGVTIFNGFQNLNIYKQAKLGVEASQLQLSILQDNISMTVINAFLNVLFNKENLKIAQEQLKISQNQLDQIKSQVEAGTRPSSDLFDVEATLASNKESIVKAENSLDLSILSLSQNLQVSPRDFDIEEMEINLTSASLLYGSSDEVLAYALENRSEIKNAELGIENSDFGIKLAQSAFAPTLSFGAGLGTSYQHNQGAIDLRTQYSADPNNPGRVIETTVSNGFSTQLENNLGYNLGFNLRVPIFNGFKTKASVSKARLNKEKSRLNLEKEKQNLTTTITQAFADAKAALKQYQATELSVASLEDSFKNIQNKFNYGAATSFEVEQIRGRLVNAKSNLINSKYNFVFRSKVLDFYMGKKIL
ncbi:TolC family protein [Flavobacteriaceae bacterium]|nr:TolC family protein [Flavobacteriaceae bacterium]